MSLLAALLADDAAELPAMTAGTGRRIAAGVWECLPEVASAPPLVLCAGIHGDETAPVELLAGLVDALCAGAVVLRRPLLVAFGNLAALRLGRRYLERDLNRCFRGSLAASGSEVEVTRALALAQALTVFVRHGPGLLLDLHSTIRPSLHRCFGIQPYSGATRPGADVLGDCGVPVVVQTGADAPTFSALGARAFGHEAYTLELGQVRAFGAGDASEFALLRAGLERQLEALPLQASDFPMMRYRMSREVIKRSPQFRLHLPEAAPNFTPLESGALIAEDGAEHWFAEEGEAVLFPNAAVACGTRAAVLVRSTAAPG